MKEHPCKQITVEEIVIEYLKENDYDGLMSKDYECACEITDLMPCGEYNDDCMAGHKVTKETCEIREECENRHCDALKSWCIIPGKRGESDEKNNC